MTKKNGKTTFFQKKNIQMFGSSEENDYLCTRKSAKVMR